MVEVKQECVKEKVIPMKQEIKEGEEGDKSEDEREGRIGEMFRG